jgi:hypothetical protein
MRLTVIPSDKFMSKDGAGLIFDFSAISGSSVIRAIQWDAAAGHVEYNDGRPNAPIAASFIVAYVEAYDAEKARLAAIAAAALEIFNSPKEVLKRKIAAIDAARDAKLAAGVPYNFPDGAGTIQMRDLIDARNIQTNVTMALILQGMGETKPVMSFRDTENVTHAMTPAQMITMGVTIAQAGQAIYAASWTVKDTAKDLPANELPGYDIEANWPK